MRSDTQSDELARFDWVHRSSINEAACLTLVRGAEIDRVANAFGAVTGQMRTYDFGEYCEEAFALYENYSLIGVRTLGDWLLVVEDNGFQGSRNEVLRRVSEGTEAVSVYWNVAGLTRFSHATQGEVRTAFEGLMPEYRSGTTPDALEELRSGLPWSGLADGSADPVSLMLALSARITGMALTPEMFDGDFLTFPVAPWPDDLPVQDGFLEDHAVRTYSRELVERLRETGVDAVRRVVCAVVGEVLDRCDCREYAVVRDTFDVLDAGGPVDGTAINATVRDWTWQLQINRATIKARNQVRAVEVLRQATNPDAYMAALGVLAKSAVISGIDAAELSATMLDALAPAKGNAC